MKIKINFPGLLPVGLTIALYLCLLSGPAFAKKSLVYPDWRESVPEPVFEANPKYVELYWKAWEYAAENVAIAEDMPQSPYMDEGFWRGMIWVWDTCFMALYTKYSPEKFPGVQSLNNFYVQFFENKILSKKIEHADNPPLMAWVEYANWTFNGMTSQGRGQDAAQETVDAMIRFHEWWAHMSPDLDFGRDKVHLRRVEDAEGKLEGFYWTGNASGMDNTPRGRGIGWSSELKVKPMLWVDAVAQLAFSAREIQRMSEEVGDDANAKTYAKKFNELKDLINSNYWDEQDGMYYDITSSAARGEKKFSRVLTPASFWPMIAGVASEEQAARMVEVVTDSNKLGGVVPFPSLSRDDPHYQDDGQYWKGAVWMPLSYMSIKALEAYDYNILADAAAQATLDWMLKTYENPEAIAANKGEPTIWECYSSTKPMPGTHGQKFSRPDFCGWSALGPISLFIENVLGFHSVDFQRKVIGWRLHQPGVQGIKQLTFGDITTSIIYDGQSIVNVESTAPYALVINDVSHAIQAGETRLEGIRALPSVSFNAYEK